MARIGPYSAPSSMAKIDGRSSEGRFLRRIRAELTEHCGGAPSATQRVIIDRAAWLRLRIATLDARMAVDGRMDECATNTYLAWTGALARLLRDLGPPAKAPKTPERAHAEFLESIRK